MIMPNNMFTASLFFVQDRNITSYVKEHTTYIQCISLYLLNSLGKNLNV